MNSNGLLYKIKELNVASWNYKGQDPLEFRHYGPIAQEFFAAFGEDGFGAVGTETTINSGDMSGIMMIAIQALEKRTVDLMAQQSQIAELEQLIGEQQAQLQRMEELLEGLEPVAATANGDN